MVTKEDAREIIKTHCGDVQERIRACRSKSIAEQLKARLCQELSHSCRSEMVQQVLTHYVDKIIQTTFDEDGKNIFLEEP